MTASSLTTSPDVRALDPAPLRSALRLDAAMSGACGILLAAAAGLLAEPLGIPSGWLRGLGVFLIVFAVDVALVAARLPGTRRLARVIAVGNVGWVLASVAVVVLGGFDLTGLGVAAVLAQAAAVSGFAALQWRAS